MALLASGAKAADPEVEQLREQLRSTALQLRQLQDQQAQAPTPTPSAAPPSADEAALKAKLAAAQAQLRAQHGAAAETAALKASLAKAQADNAALTSAAAANSAELQKYKDAYAKADDAGRAVTADRDRLKAELGAMTNVATVCQAKNDQLVAFAESLLASYKKASFGAAMLASEPFLGLKRVQLENIAQDREDAVRAARCDARLDAKGPAKPAAGAPRG